MELPTVLERRWTSAAYEPVYFVAILFLASMPWTFTKHLELLDLH